MRTFGLPLSLKWNRTKPVSSERHWWTFRRTVTILGRLRNSAKGGCGGGLIPLRIKKANVDKIIQEINKAKTVNDVRHLIRQYLSPQMRREIVRSFPEFFALFYLGFYMPSHQLKWLRLFALQLVLLLAPRDHGKSWIFSYLLPLYSIYKSFIQSNLTSVDVRILEVAKIDMQSQKTATQVRETIEKNRFLLEDFGDIRDPAEWMKTHFRCKRAGESSERDYTFEKVGVEGAITGAHFHRIVCDDIIDVESTKTVERMKAQEDWFWGTVWNLREAHTMFSMVGTRKHKRDIYSTVMSKAGWKTIKDKAIIKFPMIDDPDRPGMLKQGWLYVTDTGREVAGMHDLVGEEQIESAESVKLLTDDYTVLWPSVPRVDANGKAILDFNDKPEMMGWGIKELLFDRLVSGTLYFDREKQNEISGLEGSLFNPLWLKNFWDTRELLISGGQCYLEPVKA